MEQTQTLNEKIREELKMSSHYPNGSYTIDHQSAANSIDRLVLQEMREQSEIKERSVAFGIFIGTNKWRWLRSVEKWTNPDDDLVTTKKKLYELF